MKYGSFWWMFQPSRLRQDHALAEARDREELRDALQQTEQDRLAVADQACSGSVFFGALRNHANTRQARPTRKAASPCLTWWWPESAA